MIKDEFLKINNTFEFVFQLFFSVNRAGIISHGFSLHVLGFCPNDSMTCTVIMIQNKTKLLPLPLKWCSEKFINPVVLKGSKLKTWTCWPCINRDSCLKNKTQQGKCKYFIKVKSFQVICFKSESKSSGVFYQCRSSKSQVAKFVSRVISYDSSPPLLVWSCFLFVFCPLLLLLLQ